MTVIYENSATSTDSLDWSRRPNAPDGYIFTYMDVIQYVPEESGVYHTFPRKNYRSLRRRPDHQNRR